MAKDRQLLFIQLRARALDFRQIVMGVDRRGGISGEMFAAAQNPLPAQRFIERTGQPDDLFDGLAVAAAAQGIISLIVERNVEDRAEIEIESKKAEEPARYFAMLPNERYVIPITQLLRIRRFVPDQPQSRNAPSLLIDRDNRFYFAEIAQIIDQLPELSRALNVAAKQNVPTRLDATKERRGLRIQFEPGHSGKDQLTQRIALHTVRLDFRLMTRNKNHFPPAITL